MKAKLINIKTKEERNFSDSNIAAKRLWNMPFNHRKEWYIVDDLVNIKGSDTTSLIEFINPLNYKECLKNKESLLCFTVEEYKKRGRPFSKISITWTFEKPHETVISEKFMDKSDAEKYIYNITNKGNDGYGSVIS